LEFLGAGLVGYAGVIYYLITCLRTGNVLYVNGMWDGMSTALESIVAYIVLGDRLEHPINYIGLVMVVIGILLMKS
jgi:multidrug transporter EmrE-like cation transporter